MHPLARLAQRTGALRTPSLARGLRTLAPLSANVASSMSAGPPPAPAAEPEGYERARMRKRQAEMLREVKEGRGKGKGLKKRFWADVTVREVDGHLQVFLDERPLRHPATKQIVHIPASKPHLAAALALEWDLITSAQDATKQHRIPLTSLVCRAIDISAEGAAGEERAAIVDMLLRYLDTDSLLCWAPRDDKTGALHDAQREAAADVGGFMTGKVWPGTTVVPVLDGETLSPKSQDEATRAVIQGWVSGLSAWELAGLERAVLAGKSLLIGARLVVEWSEGPVGIGAAGEGERFGVETAARTASLEVDFQTGKWGEVEDTHDVEKEDVRRQLGSTVLLVSGTGAAQ